ncbi:MAG: 2-oxoacid:acceptor oxidoreductase family protein, partial [Treponema sp.]|nr:2-oxoacid:acceptor oxidoreductase family protein [Treponema sp.]
MKEGGVKVDALDCLSLATQAGTAKSVNIVLMGRLAKYLDFPKEAWISAIEKLVKPQFLEMNKKAFDLGYNA